MNKPVPTTQLKEIFFYISLAFGVFIGILGTVLLIDYIVVRYYKHVQHEDVTVHFDNGLLPTDVIEHHKPE